jgi:hypothetical protein
MEFYINEIKYYEEKNIEFFEHESFNQYTPKVYVEIKENGTPNFVFQFK